eukprot:COSAG06_NODE_3061_length_5906_cov_26.812468_1_plen_82_part_00
MADCPGNTYYENLLKGVEQELCTMEDVDRAVFNTLKIRFDLGLFVRVGQCLPACRLSTSPQCLSFIPVARVACVQLIVANL